MIEKMQRARNFAMTEMWASEGFFLKSVNKADWVSQLSCIVVWSQQLISRNFTQLHLSPFAQRFWSNLRRKRCASELTQLRKVS